MLQPLKSQVILKQSPKELTTASGIVLTTDVNTNAEWLEIIAMGPTVGSDLKVGTEVIINFNQSRTVKYLDEQYFVVDEAHIIIAKE